MNQYTLIGYYTDTGLTYLGHFTAETPSDAIQQLADLYPDESISIAAVIEGRHESAMGGDYIEDTDNYNGTYGDDHEDNEDEIITCHLCGKVELEHEAIQAGWIPMYWRGATSICNPVCDDCTKERIKEIDGEYALIEPENERGLDAAVRAVVNGLDSIDNATGESRHERGTSN